MSLKNFRKISPPGQDIPLHLSKISKEVSQLTDLQTYKKFAFIWKKCKNIPGMSPKIFQKKYLIKNRRYPYICLNSVRK